MSDFQQAISETLIIAGAGDGAKTTLEVVKAAIPALPSGLSEGIESIAQQVGLFRTIAQQQAETIAENTQAVLQNTAAQQTGGAASVASSIASTTAKALGGGLGLVSLVSSIVGLFRGSKQESPAALPTYTAPDPIHFEGAAPPAAGMPILAVDYGQDGRPRPIWSPTQWQTSRPAPAAAPVYAPAVTVQVQAMDSRSFLDHSDEIARAVREAILNSHALGSVVSEL